MVPPSSGPADMADAARLAGWCVLLAALGRVAWQATRRAACKVPLGSAVALEAKRQKAGKEGVGFAAFVEFIFDMNLCWLAALLKTAMQGGRSKDEEVECYGPGKEKVPGPAAAAAAAAGGTGSLSRPAVAEAAHLGAQLQALILACRAQNGSTRLRTFDDLTYEQRTADGVEVVLTECRRTQFRRLRAAAGVTEEQYFESMCSRPLSGGRLEASGKSGSIFMRSYDGRLVLKTITENEYQTLTDMLPHLVLYLEQRPQSRLCRFLGAYALTVGGTTWQVVAMANVLRRPAQQVFDLKGTTEDRWVEPSAGAVLKDLNFVPHAILLRPECCTKLMDEINEDAEFLESLGVMDYSLLVGVSPQGDAPAAEGAVQGWLGCPDGHPIASDFQLGIIDYLQRWTPKKVAAHWLKKPTIGCCYEIDTEPPAVYCRRFCKYFFRKIRVLRR